METHSVSGVPKEIKKRELALGFLLTEERAETKSPSLVDSLTTLSTEDYPSSRFRQAGNKVRLDYFLITFLTSPAR